jgi:hypothetical protein
MTSDMRALLPPGAAMLGVAQGRDEKLHFDDGRPWPAFWVI